MPTETDRTTSVRRITNPDDASVYVDLKVIDAISFVDPKSQGQETQYTLNNGSDDNRQVHVTNLTGTDGASKLDVERIDVFSVIDAADRGQETQFALDNSAEPPTHLTTHDVKIYSDDGSCWLMVRRTDSFAVADPSDSGQETVFELDNPDDDIGNPPDPLDPPDTTWDGTDINPPWRIDPWQNIIDVSWGGLAVSFLSGAS